MVNNKLVFLGGLGYKQNISNDKIKRVIDSFCKMKQYTDSSNIVMIYPSDEISMKYIEIIEKTMNELNIIHKHENKTRKIYVDVYL